MFCQNDFVVPTCTLKLPAIDKTLKKLLQQQNFYIHHYLPVSTMIQRLVVHGLANFLLERTARQPELVFYFRCCILGSGVGVLARKIRLTLTMVVESCIKHYSLDPMVFFLVTFIVGIKCFIRETFFHFYVCLIRSL